MHCTGHGVACCVLAEASSCSALLSGLSSSPWQLVAELMLAGTSFPQGRGHVAEPVALRCSWAQRRSCPTPSSTWQTSGSVTGSAHW